MILLDTNVFIYMANGILLPKIISDKDISYASITKIEALGFSKITANELILLNKLFIAAYSLELSEQIINCAIYLRQIRKMTLADSIIAATALEHNLELWTANTSDFVYIEELKLVNPLKFFRYKNKVLSV